MALRGTAAGMLEAEGHFRRIICYRDFATLVVAIERDLDRRHPPHTTTTEAAIVAAAEHHTGTAAAKIHDELERDILAAEPDKLSEASFFFGSMSFIGSDC